MRIGILGGTFDPVHNGHLALARAACEQLELDRVLFVPAFQHPFKKKIVAAPEVRLQCVTLAVSKEKQFGVSDCEIRRGGISYTVDTVKTLRTEYSEPNELYFITGGDWGRDLKKWKDIDAIFSLARFVVAPRPGFDLKKIPKQAVLLRFTPLDISSSGIRACLKRGAATSPYGK